MNIRVFTPVFFVTSLISPLTHGEEGKTGKKENVEVVLKKDDPEYTFISEFWRQVIIKRDLPSSMNYFCKPDQYKKNDGIDDSSETFKEINYANLKALYHDDCSKMIDMLPRVNVDYIHLIKLELLSDPNPLVASGGKIYKGTFVYDDGPEQFEVIFPTVIKADGKSVFISRFWMPIKMN